MINTLFQLSVQGDLEVNKLEARQIKEFADLFARDKGSIGDSEGRKKLVACGEIYYIYLVYDVRSIYYNLPVEERKVAAIKDCKLPDKWKEDEVLELAVAKYLDIFKLTSAGRAYVVAERAYHTMARDMEEMQDGLLDTKVLLRGVLKKINAKGNHSAGEMEMTNLGTEANALILELAKTQKIIMDNISAFDKLGKAVKSLAIKFAEEGGNMNTPVGGGDLGNREG